MKRYVLMICAAICLFILSHRSSAQGNQTVPANRTNLPGDHLLYAAITTSKANYFFGKSISIVSDNLTAVQSGITAGPATGFIFSCAGTPSISPHIEQVPVSGTGLTSNITVTAPGGFEVSTTPAGGYGNSLVLTESSGTVNNTIIYVRSAATAPAGRISGKVIFSSPGTGDQTVSVTGLVNTVITADAVPNQTVKGGFSTTAINFTGNAGNYIWTNNTPGIGLAASGTGNIPAFTAINNGNGPIKATITVTPMPTGLAFVPNFNKNVNIINILTGVLDGSVLVGVAPESVAISPDGRHVYVCDLNSDDIAVIDGTTFTVSNAILTGFGSQPYYVAISPDGNTLYVACSGTNTILVIDTATNTVTSTILVGFHPLCISVSPDGSTIYVTNRDSQNIQVINPKNSAILNTISLGFSPYATAISPDGGTLYVAIYGTDSRILIIDTATGNITGTIVVAPSAQSIAITPDGTKLYVTDSNANTVTVISTATNSILSTINVDNGPFGIAVSPDGSLVCVTNGSGNDVSIISTATDQVVRTVHSASAIALGDFVTGSPGCTGAPVTFTVTVNPFLPATLTASADLQGLTTTYGTASSPETFTVSGNNLTGDVLITPPSGFEVSTDGTKFSSTATITTSGTISATTIYVRLAATTPVGTYNGDIVLSSPGTTSVNLSIPNSTVARAPLRVIANNQTKSQGAPNPELTISYAGFVNGEKQDQLTTLPVATTIATTNSTPGNYVITVDGAKSPNYTFIYVDGTLTILPSLQFALIPNAFTPNGDGINDFWNIPQLAYFPNCLVSIYTRYGGLVFQSRGYVKPWDGTSKGSPVPAGTYYYVIDPRQESIRPLTGYVAVLR